MSSVARESPFETTKESTYGICQKQGFLTAKDINSIWSKYLNALHCSTFDSASKTWATWQHYHSGDRCRFILILIYISWLAEGRVSQGSTVPDYTDDQLPLNEEQLSFLPPSYCEGFIDAQWLFDPPIIREEAKMQKFRTGTKLPFEKQSRHEVGKGASGVVWEERIPPGYYVDKKKNCNASSKVVARKIFKRADHHIEIENLMRFEQSRSQHSDIMKCLAFITVPQSNGEDEISIVMDLADCGLHSFLPYQKDTFGGNKNPTMYDLLWEAAELAGALAWLHTEMKVPGEISACCHMDLKPSNILIFDLKTQPVGKWKIADFGISAIRTPKDRSYKSGDSRAPMNMEETIITAAKREPGPYTAPEIRENGKNIGRRSDIWSYGCILVDIIASKMTGEASLYELTKKRGLSGDVSHCYDHFYRDKALNENIQAWLDDLSKVRDDSSRTESAALRECEKILREILNIEADRRPRAVMIREHLIKACNIMPPPEVSRDANSIGHADDDKIPRPIDLTRFTDSFQAMQRTKPLLLDERVTADAMLLGKLEQWIMDPSTSISWVSESRTREIGAISSICSGIFQAATRERLNIILYLCDRGRGQSKPQMLADMTHFLICRVQEYINQSSPLKQPVSQDRFDRLQGPSTLADALTILGKLWTSYPLHWFCIIDDFHLLEDHTDPSLVHHIEALLQIFQSPAEADDRGGKTLIVTSGRSCSLEHLPIKDQLIADVSSRNMVPVVPKLKSAMQGLM